MKTLNQLASETTNNARDITDCAEQVANIASVLSEAKRMLVANPDSDSKIIERVKFAERMLARLLHG
jgi:hypothetical protein